MKIIDLDPDTVLDFDTFVFMPLNKKHVNYSSAGDALRGDRIERLKKHNVGSLHVRSNEMYRFYRYTAERLRSLWSDQKISETERVERLSSAVRDLISGLFTDTATSTVTGKQIVEDCRRIVSAYVAGTPNGKWMAKIMSAVSESSNLYSHLGNVSTYAALFSMALQLDNPDEVALAGFLHDIGIARVPPEVLQKPESEWTEEERRAFEEHPHHTLAIVQERKLVLPENVIKIIVQHHERHNGIGYPNQLAGMQICPGAELVSFADRFDELITVAPGQPRLEPLEAIHRLCSGTSNDPRDTGFNPELLKRIQNLFMAEAMAA